MEELKDHGLSDLAELFGKRGCCKKQTCIHRKAVYAINQIAFLEGEVKGLRERIKKTEDHLCTAVISDPYDEYGIKEAIEILQGISHANNNESESGS